MNQSGFSISRQAQASLLVWRKTLYLGSLNSNDLPRHFISIPVPGEFEY